MKFTALLISACLQVSAGGLAQTVSLSEENASLKEIFKAIHRQTGYEFLYSSRVLAKSSPVDISVTEASLHDVLAICFQNQPLTYTIYEKTIVVKPLQKPENSIDLTAQVPITVTGTVGDATTKAPLPGVNIIVKGSTRALPQILTVNLQLMPKTMICSYSHLLAIKDMKYK